MAAFFPQLLGLIPTALSAFQRLMRALGEWFNRMGDKAQAVTQHAEDLAKVVEQDPQVAYGWFITMYPDLKALLAAWPKLPSLVYVAHNVAAGQKVDMHTAITAAQLAANEVKLGKI